MRDDFCIFILTHGRADRVITISTIRASGYTGRVFLIIDDLDKQRSAYIERYGDQVLIFSKREVAEQIDDAGNFGDLRSVVYARHACWNFARTIGIKYFMQMEDDYTSFVIRSNRDYKRYPMNLDHALTLMINYFATIPALCIAMSQGGDHAGISKGIDNFPIRKAMNTLLCDIDRPFTCVGKMNDDVNTYTSLGRRGELFLTIPALQMEQMRTQLNPGGNSDMYLASGTYVKSFYSILFSPSAVKIGELGHQYGNQARIHHSINWPATIAQIIPERFRKPDAAASA